MTTDIRHASEHGHGVHAVRTAFGQAALQTGRDECVATSARKMEKLFLSLA